MCFTDRSDRPVRQHPQVHKTGVPWQEWPVAWRRGPPVSVPSGAAILWSGWRGSRAAPSLFNLGQFVPGGHRWTDHPALPLGQREDCSQTRKVSQGWRLLEGEDQTRHLNTPGWRLLTCLPPTCLEVSGSGTLQSSRSTICETTPSNKFTSSQRKNVSCRGAVHDGARANSAPASSVPWHLGMAAGLQSTSRANPE